MRDFCSGPLLTFDLLGGATGPSLVSSASSSWMESLAGCGGEGLGGGLFREGGGRVGAFLEGTRGD